MEKMQRTSIDDLAATGHELTDEDLDLASGGRVIVIPVDGGVIVIYQSKWRTDIGGGRYVNDYD